MQRARESRIMPPYFANLNRILYNQYDGAILISNGAVMAVCAARVPLYCFVAGMELKGDEI